MSWKLAKKLKETTLSGSSSSPAPSHTKQSSGTITSPSQSTEKPATSITSSSNTNPTSDSTLKPGRLTVQVYEAKGLTLPPGINRPALDRPPSSSSTAARGHDRGKPSRSHLALPYIVLEFDKNEVLLETNYGELSAPVWGRVQDFDVSRPSQLSAHIYLRPLAGSRSSSSNDIYLGGIKVNPVFDEKSVFNEWVALTGGTGSLQIRVSYQPNQNQALTIDAFDLLKVVGKGSFGKVMQVRKRDTSRIYALKTIRKAHIVSRSEVTHTLAERTVLAQVNNPFIVPLKFSFQSPEKLYLVLAFVNGGELFHHLQREGRFSIERARFYAAELLCALECLHGLDVIYRDLKPENIMLDFTGHIALCDFGLCKLNMTESDKTNTFCGTPEYLAPELLHGKGYTKTVDWWTLGVLLYEMLCGLPPFYDENVNIMYHKILYDPLRFPDDIDSKAKSLLTALLNREPEKRLGNTGAQEIKNHPFFASIDWKKLMAKRIQPPFKPSVDSAIDTSNFDQEFTSEAPTDSVVDDSQLSETVQLQFQGWSYKGGSANGVRASINDGPSSIIG